jgi:eukaryotic-like serine/threonine-protein kinase
MGNVEVGELIARRYRVLETVGRGGVGTVYKALDTRFNRVVAVKVLHHASNAVSKEQLRLEADALARLSHPNIVQVHEAGEAQDLVYLVEDYIEGPTLAQLIVDAKPLDWIYTVELIRQVGTALAHAHRHGIIHRDVKPTNIIISNEGRVLILDFGLAIKSGEPTLTQTGMVMGTLAYMSPEQVLGEPVDARSDVFSLNVVFYELLTGQRPFSADSVIASIRNIIEKAPVPPREIEQTVPRVIDEIVLKSLAKDPNQRFQSMNEFLSALDSARIPTRAAFDSVDPSDARPGLGPAVTLSPSVLEGASVAEAPSSIPAFRSPKWGWLACALVVILLGTFAIVLRSIGIAISTIVLGALLVWFLLHTNRLKTPQVATGAASYTGSAIPSASHLDRQVDAGELDTVEIPPYTPSRLPVQQKMTVAGDLLDRYKQLAQSQYPTDIPLEMRQRIEEFDAIWDQLMSSTRHDQ